MLNHQYPRAQTQVLYIQKIFLIQVNWIKHKIYLEQEIINILKETLLNKNFNILLLEKIFEINP